MAGVPLIKLSNELATSAVASTLTQSSVPFAVSKKLPPFEASVLLGGTSGSSSATILLVQESQDLILNSHDFWLRVDELINRSKASISSLSSSQLTSSSSSSSSSSTTQPLQSLLLLVPVTTLTSTLLPQLQLDAVMKRGITLIPLTGGLEEMGRILIGLTLPQKATDKNPPNGRTTTSPSSSSSSSSLKVRKSIFKSSQKTAGNNPVLSNISSGSSSSDQPELRRALSDSIKLIPGLKSDSTMNRVLTSYPTISELSTAQPVGLASIPRLQQRTAATISRFFKAPLGRSGTLEGGVHSDLHQPNLISAPFTVDDIQEPGDDSKGQNSGFVSNLV